MSQGKEIETLSPLHVVLSLSILIAGCVGDEDPPMSAETGDETGCVPENAPIELEHCGTVQELVTPQAACGPCYDECNYTYYCYFEDGTQPEGGCPICADNESAANSICQSEDFLDDPLGYAVEQPCYLPISCPGWDPINEVSGGSPYPYEVDQTFIDSVIADPSLLKCDAARFEYNAGAQVFVLSGVVTGGLLYELGFQNGDKPLKVNNYSVQNAAQVAATFGILYFTEPSSYTIEVLRGTSSVFIYVDVN